MASTKKPISRLRRILDSKCLILFILFLFLSARVLVLFTNQQYGDGDEALIGVMALNIIDEGERPFFFYGQSYNGGGALEAYAASVLFRFFEPSYLVLKLQGLVFSALTLLMGYLLLRKYFSLQSANIFALLYTFAVGNFSVWNLKVDGGYVETPLFIIALIYLLYAYLYGKEEDVKVPLVMGVLCGVAVWVHDFIIPFILCMVLGLYLVNKTFFLSKKFLVFFLSFIIALIPLFIYNIKNCYLHLHHEIFGSPMEGIMIKILGYFFPSCEYLASSEVHGGVLSGFVSYASSFLKFFGPLWPSKLYLLILASLILWLFYINKDFILPWARSLIPNSKYNLRISKQPKEMLLLLFLCFNLLIFFARGATYIRYFLFTYLLLLLLMSISLDKLWKMKHSHALMIRRFSGAFLMILIVIGGFHLFAVVKTENRGLGELIQILDQNEVSHVYTNGYLQWALIFESKKRILASCDHIGLCDNRYPAYHERVNSAEQFAYVFVENSKIEREFLIFTERNSISFQKRGLSIDFFENQPQTIETDANEINVYFDLSKPLRPAEFVNDPIWDDSFE